MAELREVEVLLATYNGERFIGEFLRSLAAQKDVAIHLRISDDQSKDRTLEICNEFKNAFASLTIESGPGRGPAANFYSLLKSSTHEYLAFADQDDLWLPNHLIDSIHRLEKRDNVPALTFAPVYEFDSELAELGKIWPPRFPKGEIREILTWNPARGCTIVLNRKAAEVINSNIPTDSLMHDWWFLLSIFSTGVVSWSTTPEIRYRLHETNTVGVPRSISQRFSSWMGNLGSAKWPILQQAEELLRIHGGLMTQEMRIELTTWCRQVSSKKLMDKVAIALYRRRYRATFFDEIVVRITLVILPISRVFKWRSKNF